MGVLLAEFQVNESTWEEITNVHNDVIQDHPVKNGLIHILNNFQTFMVLCRPQGIWILIQVLNRKIKKEVWKKLLAHALHMQGAIFSTSKFNL